MIRTETQLNGRLWVDLVEPTKAELQQISVEYGLPLRPLMNCLDPEHLPKYETLGDTAFVVLRVPDPTQKPKADCIETLTTKIALFLKAQLILTVHRLDHPFLRNLREECALRQGSVDPRDLLKNLISGTINSFDPPLVELEKKAEAFEEAIFQGKRPGRLIREGYYLKRQASASRKVLKFTVDVLNKMPTREDFQIHDFQDLKERTDRLLFYTEDVFENVTALLNLHVALSSQKTNEASFRTNEIIRVLTVFSIFFLPLNFIAGIYGMNFKWMPELEWQGGYFAVLGLMALVSLTIFLWMYRRGWVSPREDESQRKAS